MNKIKKIFISFGAFFSSFASRVLAATITQDSIVETKYGVFEPEPTIGEKFLNIGKFIIPIVLFVIGLFVVLNKKITKKVKTIIISVFIVFILLFLILVNYLSYSIIL